MFKQYVLIWLDLKQTEHFADWYGRGRVDLPVYNFHSIWRKEFEKKFQEVGQNADVSIFEHSFLQSMSRAFTRNAIKSVADMIFQFCFHL